MDDMRDRVSQVLGDRYRVEGQIGAGGAAVVFAAVDLRHVRAVAIKVLRPEVAAAIGPERFLREIEVTAALQHPNILTLLDSGADGELLFYVMPRVLGPSLRDRLSAEGQLPIDDALDIARSVAAALDYAHRQDFVHRDIKPENVLLQDGRAVVADFGIAVALASAGAERLTRTGLVVGTPHYMSPEQAAGDTIIDARTDLYSLGCVCYEMLTGEPPHTGPNPQAILTRRLSEPAPDVTTARPTVPYGFAQVVAKALERLPADRFRTAAEFEQALARDSLQTTAVRALQTRPDRGRGVLWVALVAAIVAAVAGWLRPSASPAEPIHLAIPSGDLQVQIGFQGPSLAISPDGRTIAFLAADSVERRLFLRSISEGQLTPVDGSTGAFNPFFSSNSRWLGFFVNDQLRRLDLTGGPPVTLAAVPGESSGAAWLDEDRVAVTNRYRGGINLVSGTNSVLTPLTSTEPGELTHRHVEALPGGQTVLFSNWVGDEWWVTAQRLEDGTRTRITPGRMPRYVDGLLLLTRAPGAGDGSTLYGAQFDPVALELTTEPVPLLDGIATGNGAEAFALADNGTLVYVPVLEEETLNRLLWIDRSGRQTALTPSPGLYGDPRFSPDGSLLLFTQVIARAWDVWSLDRADLSVRRITEDGGTTPEWTHGGTRIAYVKPGAQPPHVVSRRWPNGPEQVLTEAVASPRPLTWSPLDGALYLRSINLGTVADILRLNPDGRVEPVLASSDPELWADLSPDGRWLAYAKGTTIRSHQIFVEPVDSEDAPLAVTGPGASQPRWGGDGRTLYYVEGRYLKSVGVETEPSVRVGTPVVRYDFGEHVHVFPTLYDVHPGGDGFVTVQKERAGPGDPVVILNWLQSQRETIGP